MGLFYIRAYVKALVTESLAVSQSSGQSLLRGWQDLSNVLHTVLCTHAR
jgi:hypothetical protein